MNRFGVGILEGDHINPMHRIIYQRTSTWFTHAVMFKNDKGDIWDARMAGIENNNISIYAGRRLIVLVYKYDYDPNAFETWLAENLSKAVGYDFKALLGFLTGDESFQCDNRWYCSEYPYRMFQDTGHKITRVVKPFWYPADFYFSSEFEVVWEGDAGECLKS
jgi:hypothetical protein